MSVRLGNNIIAGRSSQPSLFDFKWADHILNDPQWIRADTNSWQYKVAYDAAYDHLEADIQDKEAQSETISGISITYYLANDGHKICLPDQAEYIDALYDTTGIAWYYIIDTFNQRFKVPRTKWGFTGLRNQTAVGNYIAEGLPNITGATAAISATNEYTIGALSNSNKVAGNYGAQFSTDYVSKNRYVTLDASQSNPIYGNSLTVQPRATQMYLYFFMGSFTQTALVNAAEFNIESISSVLDEQTTTIAETWDTASETIAGDMATIAEDMEQLDTMINAQYHPNIFEFKWSDAILNDIQWLRSDTFSWQSGDVYETAYQHLLDDIAGKTLQTETVEGTTISYYLADDGHKICPDTQEDNVAAIYNTTGTAWYYLISQNIDSINISVTAFNPLTRDPSRDVEGAAHPYAWHMFDGVEEWGVYTVDEKPVVGDSVYAVSGSAAALGTITSITYNSQNRGKFKLPRTTFGFVGKRGSDPVGKYVAPGLPNITGSWTSQYNISMDNNSTCKGAIASTYSTGTGYYGSSSADSSWGYGFNFDASASNAIYGASTTVQAPATEMYLYFYVGKFLQSAIVNTAGIAAEQLNTLTADVTDLNSHKVIAFQAPTSENNYTWYRKYADGWVEQGGFYTTSSSAGTYYFNIPITMSDLNYTIVGMYNQPYTTDWTANTSFAPNTVSQVKVSQRTTVSGRMSWVVYGMYAQS